MEIKSRIMSMGVAKKSARRNQDFSIERLQWAGLNYHLGVPARNLTIVIKGLYTPSEKRACNSHSDCRNIEIFQRY